MGIEASKPIVTLADSVKPFLATAGGVTATTFESFRIQPRQYISQINVLDVKTNQPRFQLQTGSSIVTPVTQTLQTSSGGAGSSVEAPKFPEAVRVYDGNQMDIDSIRIAYEMHVFWPSVVFAEFKDRLSGDACRVVIEGDTNDYDVFVYLERAPKTLSPLSKKDDRKSGRFQAIGRIRIAPGSDRASKEYRYIVDAVPGVDLSLLLQLWKVRHEIEVRPPSVD